MGACVGKKSSGGEPVRGAAAGDRRQDEAKKVAADATSAAAPIAATAPHSDAAAAAAKDVRASIVIVAPVEAPKLLSAIASSDPFDLAHLSLRLEAPSAPAGLHSGPSPREALAAAVDALQDIKSEWTERQEAMRVLGALLDGPGADRDLWWPQLERLAAGCTKQTNDLRSSVVRSACALIVHLALRLGSDDKFAGFALAVAPALLSRLYVTVRAIAQACDDCMRGLLAHGDGLRLAPLLAKAASDDAHAAVRFRSVEYLARLVVATPPAHVGRLAVHADALCATVLCAERDADKTTRAAARQLFQALHARLPESAEALAAKLKPATRKLASNSDSPIAPSFSPSPSPRASPVAAAKSPPRHVLRERRLAPTAGAAGSDAQSPSDKA